MSTKITVCGKCSSTNIKETNTEARKTATTPLCKIDCCCLDCGFIFNISSWTEAGKRKGVWY